MLGLGRGAALALRRPAGAARRVGLVVGVREVGLVDLDVDVQFDVVVELSTSASSSSLAADAFAAFAAVALAAVALAAGALAAVVLAGAFAAVFLAAAVFGAAFAAGAFSIDSSGVASASVSFALRARVVVFVPEVTFRLSPADECRAPPGRFRTLVRPLSSPRTDEEASQSRLTTGQIIYCLTLAGALQSCAADTL